ncbi:MAG: hypothetical protein HC897_03550, partial [Thermoanaerobaculia bacterium]|nr:hypothetical protein [Thermoanaerobaculia bacterium]
APAPASRFVGWRSGGAKSPVFEGYRGLRFDADGQLEEIFGDHAPMPGEVTAEPAITKEEAFAAAFAHVAALPLKRRCARLVLFYHHPRLRLGWDLELSLARGEDQIQVIVDAAENPGEILYCRSLLATAVHAWVYRTNPGESERVEIEWPRDWVDGDALRGNNARCHFANATSSLRGEPSATGVRFAPAEPLGEEQWVVNAFGWANELHDFFAARGFGESEGNLQKRTAEKKAAAATSSW